MSEIWVEGGKSLDGEVTVQGSKNAVLPMMAACLLQEGTVVLSGCPRITDVLVMEKILASLGAETCWEGDRLSVSCDEILQTEISDVYAESMRSSVLLMGSMLVRMGSIKIAYPGGCRIGKRPIDVHLAVFQKMGACICEEQGALRVCCPHGLQAISFQFPFSSVGATENAILAAVGANGVSYLQNCAIEPEVTHLCNLLTKMGAKIHGIGTRNLEIIGGCRLCGIEFEVPADRIVAGTYLYAAAATRGCCKLYRAPIQEMQSVLHIYEKMGGQWDDIGGILKVNAREICYPISCLMTAGYPGFPTDLQSILMPVLLTIPGRSCICENIFENRFQIISQLQKMGAHICASGNCAYLQGGTKLHGACVAARELRGGAALVVAALAAEGITQIRNAEYVLRGYEDIDICMQQLGASVTLRH